MGVFRGGGPIAPQNCRSTTTDRLAALLLLQCKAYWIRKPDDSTSFSSVNELKEIAEVVRLIDISAAFLFCVLCSYSHRVGQKATPNTPHTTLPVNWPIFKIFQCRILHEICNKVIVIYLTSPHVVAQNYMFVLWAVAPPIHHPQNF